MKFKSAVLATLLFTSSASFAYEPVTYIFDDGSVKEQVTVTTPPKRAVTMSTFMT